MNFEKFTTKLQEALAEAQSLAVAKITDTLNQPIYFTLY